MNISKEFILTIIDGLWMRDFFFLFFSQSLWIREILLAEGGGPESAAFFPAYNITNKL